jgi:hypothetical protein
MKAKEVSALLSAASAALAGEWDSREVDALHRGHDELVEALRVFRRGGRLVLFSEAECKALSLALGNSLGDSDYLEAYTPNARNRACALGAWGKLK